ILRIARPFPDFEEYAVSTSADTSYMKLWSTLRTSTFYSEYAVSRRPQYAIFSGG
ncbi:hypothetical protein Tco_1535641, partial [Tanacetum coccineum]